MKRLKLLPKSLWRGSVLQLIGVIILPLALLVLIIAISSTWLHQQAMRTMVGERDMLTTRTIADSINAAIGYRLTTLETLAVTYESSTDPFLTQEITTHLVPDQFDLGLAIFSATGDLNFRSSNIGMAWDRFLLSPDFEGLLKDRMCLGTVIEWEIEHNPALLLCSRSPGQRVIAAGAMTVDGLTKEIIPGVLPATQEGRLLIVNRDLQIVYQSGYSTHEPFVITHLEINQAFSGISGTFLFKDRGIEYVVSYSPVVVVDWVLVMVEPWEAVSTPLLEITRVAPLVLVPVLLISLIGLWFGSQQIVKPLRKLEQQSDSISEGNFDKIKEPVKGIAEIRHLQTKLIQMAQKVQTSQQSLKDYIGAITDAQEEERRRLARELHDDTIQSMIALKQRIQLARNRAVEATSQQSLEELETIAEQTIENLQRTTRALRPIYLEDLGLVASLEMLTKETTALSGLTVDFSSEGVEKRLSPQVELAFYRIAQEALNNIVRHAGASQVMLKVRFDEFVTMIIVDDGVSFTSPKTTVEFASSGHFGLMGMYERAELIGANLEINASPGQGTQVLVSYLTHS